MVWQIASVSAARICIGLHAEGKNVSTMVIAAATIMVRRWIQVEIKISCIKMDVFHPRWSTNLQHKQLGNRWAESDPSTALSRGFHTRFSQPWGTLGPLQRGLFPDPPTRGQLPGVLPTVSAGRAPQGGQRSRHRWWAMSQWFPRCSGIQWYQNVSDKKWFKNKKHGIISFLLHFARDFLLWSQTVFLPRRERERERSMQDIPREMFMKSMEESPYIQ